MRGKASGLQSDKLISRITPAYAGKRLAFRQSIQRRRDHPRLCGEKQAVPCVVLAFTGSPPPMRGKVEHMTTKSEIGRITPAYAGKREIANDYQLGNEDHPRLCGEKGGIPPLCT